ncbi:MAG: fused MFS/spermidine synthase [Bacteroidales bacterium]|nr:fused MFS/spermidine synthase [Bacteroidales bacterium]
MKKYLLETAVFLCGAIVMIYEIVGSRVVAPHFGTSIYVWTSLIGIILASLSIGYWLGGKIADRSPTFRSLSGIILLGAIFILVTALIKDPLLRFISHSFSDMILRTLLAAILLFAPASIMLGMVSPYAVRLKIKAVDTSGSIVGNLYAISTVGSIAGTFLAGFVLIPLAGSTSMLYILAICLVLVSLLLYFTFRKAWGVNAIVIIAIAGSGLYINNAVAKTYVETDTRYNHVQIFDTEYWITGEPIKVMKVNNEYSSAMYPDSDELVYVYLQFYRLAEHFKPDFQHALVIGGAGYSFPMYYLKQYPDATIDVVEIDPGLTALAREYFRLKDNPRMRIFHEDGRTYLNNSAEKYDIIFGDAYKSLLAVPFQLASLEAIERKYELLNDDGIVIENIIASMEGPASKFLKAECKTYLEVFPQVYLFACHNPEDPSLLQSISLVACKSPEAIAINNEDPAIDSLLKHMVTIDIPPGTIILTDDHAPTEYFALKAQ